MATYLLTWNPDEWPWETLQEELAAFRAGAPVTRKWVCRNKAAGLGDRVFLMRQGVEPRGIFGAGRGASAVFDDAHFDTAKAAKGEEAPYIDVTLDAFFVEPIIERARLLQPDLRAGNWSTRRSGILLPEEVAARLELVWAEVVA